jgi:hypothetical protein
VIASVAHSNFTGHYESGAQRNGKIKSRGAMDAAGLTLHHQLGTLYTSESHMQCLIQNLAAMRHPLQHGERHVSPSALGSRQNAADHSQKLDARCLLAQLAQDCNSFGPCLCAVKVRSWNAYPARPATT